MVIYITFENGFVGTLTHHDPGQIREWMEIFGTPDAKENCRIVGISVENALPEAA